jgi:hypothetical protein
MTARRTGCRCSPTSHCGTVGPSFTFRCHDIGEAGTIIGGPVLYDLADTAEVMHWYRELLPSLPEELNGWIALLTIPPRSRPGSCLSPPAGSGSSTSMS